MGFVGEGAGQGSIEEKVVMKLTFLGTGEAFDANNPNTSILVNGDFLLDCGYSIPQIFWELELDVNQVKTVWLSHFHGDHTFGVPALLMRFWEGEELIKNRGREEPLTVVGPKGVKEYVHKILELAYGDFIPKFEYKIEYREVEPGNEIEVNGYKLNFADTKHTKDYMKINNQEIKKTALAIRVSKGGKSFVYTGDSPYSEDVVKLAKGCDLLIHEAYLPLQTKQELMNAGKATNHCSWEEAGVAARKARVKSLALVHVNRDFYGMPEKIIDEASQMYEGKILLPKIRHEIEL